MKVQLSVRSQAGGRYKFLINFVNNSDELLIIPFEKMQRTASRVGLFISEGENALEPIAFDVVNYRESPQLRELPPHSSAEIVLSAELKKAGASSHILVLDSTTYRVCLGHSYEISFRMDEFESNTIHQVFEM
jgi:hypothetical protein